MGTLIKYVPLFCLTFCAVVWRLDVEEVDERFIDQNKDGQYTYNQVSVDSAKLNTRAHLSS